MSDRTPMRVTCHCGANELRVFLAAGLEDARRCDCSFCRRRGAMNVSVREADLQVIKGDALTLYQFGPRGAEHYFCKVCGCYTHHRRSSDNTDFGVNVGCLEGVNPADIDPVPWLDGVSYNPGVKEKT